MAGEVVEVGAGANATVGDTVAICPMRCCGVCSFCREGFRNRCPNRRTLGYDLDGGIAEYVQVPAQMVAQGHLLPMNPADPPQLRAFVEPLACVLNSLEELGVRAGAPFAIVGGGPMGLVHLIAGRAYGAGPILVVEPEAARRAVALELGADAVCTPADAPDVSRELTRGEGFPSVAMAVGFADAVPTSIAITRKLGRVNFFAGFPPGSMHNLDLNQVHYDEVKLFGTQNAPFHLYHRASQMAGGLAAIDRVITNRYSLPEAADAYSARLGKDGLKSVVLMS
jgi:threonine dehydrogenase-like Zn-dependent dehydrogenase